MADRTILKLEIVEHTKPGDGPLPLFEFKASFDEGDAHVVHGLLARLAAFGLGGLSPFITRVERKDG